MSEEDISLVVSAADQGRYGPRNSTMISFIVTYFLRLFELRSIRTEQIDLSASVFWDHKKGDRVMRKLSLADCERLSLIIIRGKPGPLFGSTMGNSLSSIRIEEIILKAGRAAGLRYDVSPRLLYSSAFSHFIKDNPVDPVEFSLDLEELVKSSISARPKPPLH